MDFVITCACGRTMTVSTGSAGARIPCSCGDFFRVPSLGELRKSVGLPAVEVPLEIELSDQIESGELPLPTCIGCGAAGADVVDYVAECETMISKNSNTVLVVLSVLVEAFSPIMLPSLDDGPSEARGRDLAIPVPARVCDHCLHSQFSPPQTGRWKYVGGLLAIAGLAGMFWKQTYLAQMLEFRLSVMATVAGGVIYALAGRMPKNYQKRIRRGLSHVPVYQRVFQKYPDAVVTANGTKA